ncbi:hypothetical protein RvY_09955 [Ramazzottius varieornatus]|uniref:FAD synthase n=1 Tax=Ramazzottius varieornatus TaxID=947166 RepID=A0A1D1VFN1_RAMVA|nr:hypothetical protein RvY_09955 [Ramazzottius varieornatus]
MEADPAQEDSCTPPLRAFDPSVFLGEESVRRNHPLVINFHRDVLPAAVDVVRAAFRQYAGSPLAVAFNGGKDCTVLLDLVIRTFREFSSEEDLSHQSVPILAVYFRSRPQFPEVEKFIQEKIRELDIPLEIYDGDLKESLGKFVQSHPSVKGIFMGTRSGDPRSQHLEAFSPTDPSWPPIMRILPLLKMSYHNIWLYLLDFKVSYCKMYDNGYSSIGWKYNTFVNPKLVLNHVDGRTEYKPAYLLEDSDEERLYRK